jgi:VWFA-related protein
MPTTLRRDQVRRTVALVVDDLGLSFGSVDSVRSALKKFVDEQMQPGDVVAIIRTGSGVGVLQQFTSDKRVLYAAIKRVRWSNNGRGGIDAFQPVNPSDSGVGGQPAQSGEPIDLHNQFNEFREDVFAVGTLGAINYVVKGMRELPGRKAVVVFSDGFGMYGVNEDISGLGKDVRKPNARLLDSFQRLIESANRASVTIYPMDARGIVNPLFVGANDSFYNYIPSGGVAVEKLMLDRSSELTESQQAMRDLAARTGGFAVINNNDLAKGLERVLNDQRGYYLIGYRPDSETFDPKQARFHTLSVKLKRPDLHVRYRSGFFGVRDEDIRPAPKTPRQQILAALTSPCDNAAKSNLVMQYKAYRDGKEIFAGPEVPLKVNAQSDPSNVDASGVIELGRKMLPGDYVLQISVKDLSAGKKDQLATQWTDFEIMP